MVRSFYIAATGMVTERQKMNVITNNITNVETIGYKADTMVTREFDEMLISRLNDDPNVVGTYVGPLVTGIYADVITTTFGQGISEQTEQTTDMAIIGDGFFTVDTPSGTRYTRNGNFNVDIDGDLVTQQGYYVLGQDGGRINVGTEDFTVAQDGRVLIGEEELAVLEVVSFEDLEGLRKMGDNTYVHFENEVPTRVENPQIWQGYVEGSNVDITSEITDMMMTSNVYDANQRIAKMVDETLSLTVKEVGQV